MVSVTFYGGVNEIGGNKILVESKKARIWLDFGLSFGKVGKFYDEFIQPRKSNAFGDYFEMGLIPNLKGLYRSDFLKRMGRKDEKLAFDGVFVSHAHIDHTGYISLLNEKMPIYCGFATKLFMKAMQDTTNGYESELLYGKVQFTGLPYGKVPEFDRQVHTFRTGNKIEVKDLVVEPIHVDHSIPGAYGHIIHTPEGAIAYTGDLRAHGTKPELTKDFIRKAAAAEPEVLITEGTRVDGEPSLSEPEVKEKISAFIKETKGLVVANFPPRDIDRFNTFYKASVENGRKLVITTKQAYLLQLLEQDKVLKKPALKDKHILVHIPKTGDGTYVDKEYQTWQRPFLHLPNAVKAEELRKMQDNVVFYCNAWQFSNLIDIKPKEGSSYIYSLTEPFNDEMELDFVRVHNWIKHFKLKYHTAHASGHMSNAELKQMIEEINPKKVIPVHTEKPELFRKIAKNVEIVKEGKPYQVS